MKKLVYEVTLHKEGEDGRLYWAGLQEEDEDLQALPFLGHVVWVEWMRSKKSTTSECGAVATGKTYQEAVSKAIDLGRKVWGVESL